MPPSSGRIVKKKAKPSTPHQKNHRWESFTAKISKLHSLDPIKKIRRYDLDAEDDAAETSYFGTAVQKWAEMNISRSFVSFRRDVTPLCETLVQIIHFEDRIFGLLATHIEANDKESLEPLLDLLTAFAHDLGARFEKYYARALALIVGVAGQPQNADVIEWTFGALAFLFKYLSKLVVPDMRPTYDVLAPLLGKVKNPPHIARFAAEAMSFLVKKSAAPSTRESSLQKLVLHVRKDLYAQRGERQFTLFKDGIMTMFAEACKGTGETIHSNGSAVIIALMRAIPSDEYNLTEESVWTDVTCGVITSIIHHSNATTLAETVTAICEYGNAQIEVQTQNPTSPWRLLPIIRAYGTLIGVRKGSRISGWTPLVKSMIQILEAVAQAAPSVSEEQQTPFWNHAIFNVAVMWQLAPIDSLITSIVPFTNIMNRDPFARWYIQFCSLFAELDSGRFKSLFLNPFQSFVATCYSDLDNEELLCLLLPRLLELSAIPYPNDKDGFNIPQGWQAQIVNKFEKLEILAFPEHGAYDKDPRTWRDKCLPKYASLLQVLESCRVQPSTNARIGELMLRKLKLSLRPTTTLDSDEVHFIVSRGFHAYLRMIKGHSPVDASLQPLLRAALPRFGRSVGFLESMLAYEQQLAVQERSAEPAGTSAAKTPVDIETVAMPLVANLSAPSHEVRYNSLLLLREVFRDQDQSLHEVLDSMVSIEHTPLELASTRHIGMLMRKLGISFGSIQEPWLQKAVASFLFGTLTVKLAPVWDYTIEAMQKVAETKMGEDLLSVLAFDWLAVPSPRWTGPPSGPGDFDKRVVTDFECTNIERTKKLSGQVFATVQDAVSKLLATFDAKQSLCQAYCDQARGRALKAFAALPLMAETKSRLFVPHLLSWAVNDEEEADTLAEETERDLQKSWSLADRKAMLKVVEQFVNPRVLFQHEKVYKALLSLLENGDVDIQRLALKGILTWKQDGVRPYAERLEALLDDSKFKNELTLLLQGENEIQTLHREELMPVLLRLLYGRTISKKGIASGRHGLQATRLAVLRNLSVADLGSFIDISLGALRGVRIMTDTGSLKAGLVDQELVPVRQQFGFLNMAAALINELGTAVLPYTETLANAVLYCVFFSARRLRGIAEEAAAENEPVEEHASTDSLLRSARVAGLKCLISLFRNAPAFEWTPYAGPIVAELVSPRLDKLPVESAQGVSNMLRLVEMWSQLPKAALFVGLDAQLLPKMMEILAVEKAKDDVKVFALRVVRNLVKIAEMPAAESEFNELVRLELLEANLDCILKHITISLEAAHSSHDIIEACVDTIIDISPFVDATQNIRSVLDISTRLLGQPARKVSPRTKGKILLVLEKFVALEGPRLVDSSDLSVKIRHALAGLFSYFKDRENRDSLCRVLGVLAQSDATLAEPAALCTELNAYAEGLSDEPAYDRRLDAYNAISRARETPLTPSQWMPVLHNLVFFLKFDEEYGILASNSADGLRRFVEDVAAADVTAETGSSRSDYELLLKDIVLPAMYSGAREVSETVRRECLRVMGHMLVHVPEWEPIADMKGLRKMEADTSEPIFFFNLLSPAMAKQLEAFEILKAANAECEISSTNLSMFFIPLLEHFIFSPNENQDPAMGSNATTVLAAVAVSLEFRHYRSILLRYIGYIESKPDFQKQNIRLMGRFADSLMTAWGKKREDKTAEAGTEAATEAEAEDPDKMAVDSPTETQKWSTPRLALTVPDQPKLSADIINNFLPPMMKHLHEKDESEVSYRVPVGVIIVKLLVMLPESEMSARLASVLTDICHILRSKAWESREMARDTLVKIAVVLGAKYFGFILNELKGALQRGYQLHVLSYTMHSLLLAVIPEFGQGSLDYCLSTMVTIIMDDIFGVIGQEKDADGYTTTMKEIKASKSQDSMELISKTASITHLVDLIAPMQQMLLQKVDLKIVRKIDALLTRISAGLIQNPAADSRDSLVFCYEVIKDVYASQKVEKQPKIDPKLRRYLIVKGAKKSDRGATTKHTYKLISFAIDLLRAVTKRFDSLRSGANLAGFIPILGDAVIDGEEEVKIAVFKLLVTISKVPFSAATDAPGVYKVAVKEATKAISQSASTTTDAAQAALKFLSVVLRDRPDIEVRPVAVDMLVEKLKDDLTNPLYRHVTFNFLRSVLDRKLETAAVYDILDYVGTIMITNEDKDTRDLARGAFFQFLRDYPQKKARWAKQLRFIVSNLQYEREGGRVSVMEIIHLLLQKTADDFVREVAATCFLPLVMVLANDDAEKCRLAAAELVKQIFRRAGPEHTATFLGLLRGWLAKSAENAAVFGLGLKTFALYYEAGPTAADNKQDLKLVLTHVDATLPGEYRADQEEEAPKEVDPDLANTVVDVIRAVTQRVPEVLLAPAGTGLWTAASRLMVHGDNGVKLNAARLVSQYLMDFAANRRADSHVMKGSYGQELDSEGVQRFARLALRILTTREMEEELAMEAGQMLIFLGQNLAQAEMREEVEAEDEQKEAEGEEEGEEGEGKESEEKEEEAEAEEEKEGQDEEKPDIDPEAESDSLDTKSFNLHFLFKKLSFILRRGTAPRALAIYPKVAAMQVLETLCRRVSPASLPVYLKTVLLALYHVTDPSISTPFSIDETFKAKHEGVRTRAQILMDLLKKRVGVAAYTEMLLRVRAEVRARRRERQMKRKIEAVSMPEKYGRDKRKKFERKKVKRQQRGKDHKAMRQSYKGW
ncbi:hypothetical protein TD95_002691 [Thielaviopsis punctulata]|uniref:Uncharacterized protein n=1 Tax=Thielaviopsis punctulata TaxID=72032 RepID=A0A0F4ZH49_9PEZI|nr:hypothetical protein TD95_002691 [Thielaviopsis punctulata]